MAFLVLLVIIVVVVLGLVGIYNKLVSLRVRSENAWSDIDVQLKRRADLVPNLVNTVKGYATHERETLDSVTQARARVLAAQGGTPAQRAQAEGELTNALRGLTVAVEAYPQLQASGGFRDLQHSGGTRIDGIAVSEGARQFRRANSEDPGTFKLDEDRSRTRVTWYYRAQDETRTFTVSQRDT